MSLDSQRGSVVSGLLESFFISPYLQPEKTSEYRTTAFLSRCVITYGVFDSIPVQPECHICRNVAIYVKCTCEEARNQAVSI